MSVKHTVILLVLLAFVGFSAGCSDSDDDSGGNSPTGPSSGTYAGTWTGNVCSRGLTMNLTQSGTTISGSYTLTDPTFSEGLSGSVSSTSPPASAVLYGGGDRRFEITFSSYTSFSGGYLKGNDRVCDARASKQ